MQPASTQHATHDIQHTTINTQYTPHSPHHVFILLPWPCTTSTRQPTHSTGSATCHTAHAIYLGHVQPTHASQHAAHTTQHTPFTLPCTTNTCQPTHSTYHTAHATHLGHVGGVDHVEHGRHVDALLRRGVQRVVVPGGTGEGKKRCREEETHRTEEIVVGKMRHRDKGSGDMSQGGSCTTHACVHTPPPFPSYHHNTTQ